MLSIGCQRQRTCQTWDRRAFLQAGFSSVLGLSWADWLRARALAPDAVAGPAKSVVLIWLWGGPAHLDTWDPKPNAPLEYRGPFQPIATRVPGVRIGELFPRLANCADQFSILRGLHTASNDHGVAGTIGLTGSDAGSINLGGNTAAGRPRPALGAVVARTRGQLIFPTRLLGGGRKAASGQESNCRGRRWHARWSLRSLSPGICGGRRLPHSRVRTHCRSNARAPSRSPAADDRTRSGRASRGPGLCRAGSGRLSRTSLRPADGSAVAPGIRPEPREGSHAARPCMAARASGNRACWLAGWWNNDGALYPGELERSRGGGKKILAMAAGITITATSRSCRIATPLGSIRLCRHS